MDVLLITGPAAAERQLACLASPDIRAEWVVDTSDLTLEETYERFFSAFVASA